MSDTWSHEPQCRPKWDTCIHEISLNKPCAYCAMDSELSEHLAVHWLAAKMAEPTDTPLYVWLPDGIRSEWAIVDGYWRRTDKAAAIDDGVTGSIRETIWDTLHRTEDAGYWIPAESARTVKAHAYNGLGDFITGNASIGARPNKYTQISTEPERPVTEEESQAIGRALVRSVKLIPNPYGGLTSNPDPAKFCAHGIPLIQSCRNCQGAKVAAACAVARGGR